MKKELKPECAFCKVEVRRCRSKEGSAPAFCPTVNREEDIQAAKEKYQAEAIRHFAKNASLQEAECYSRRDEKPFVMRPTKTRVEEIIGLAKKMGHKKLGVAFCAGLFAEARTFVEILGKHGFEVVSVCCKAGGVSKEFLGIKDHEKVRVGTYETMCNPILQAELMNREKTDFNVLVGLCVGHDALFLKNAQALTSVLVAKDRVLGHNPVAALYGIRGYFQKLMIPEKEEA